MKRDTLAALAVGVYVGASALHFWNTHRLLKYYTGQMLVNYGVSSVSKSNG